MEWIDAKTQPPKQGEYVCLKYKEPKETDYYYGAVISGNNSYFLDQIGDVVFISECEYCYWLKED